MIAGVQKGGTTSLDAYLRQHPDISMAKKKEVHFFDKRPPTGIRPLDYWIYHQQFHWNEKARGAKLGEATPIRSIAPVHQVGIGVASPSFAPRAFSFQ